MHVSRLLALFILRNAASRSSAFSFRSPHHRNAETRRRSTTSSRGFVWALAAQKVFVAGGSRGVGRCIIDQLTAQGKEVVALVRKTEDADLLNQMDLVTAIVGDAVDQKVVENAMDGCDAAITTLGGSVSDQGNRIDYEGNNNVVESAGILGVTRVILVSSIGCGSSKEAAPPSTFAVLKDVLAAKERAENVLIKYYTNTDWTIIRPGGLKSEPATGNAILTEDPTAIGSIHREDVAALALQALESDKTIRKILSAVDPTITSAVNVEGRDYKSFALA
jgi:nucleoside-diphosphate-sugar epimerase